MNNRTKKITVLAMLCALAYAVMALSRMLPPIVMWLKYDPKDVIIAIGGMIWGPLATMAMSLIVSLLELVTVSDTGLFGLLMNVISSCAFATTAALIYKKKRDVKGAVIGLIAGVVVMVIAMMLWNYLITPIYMTVGGQPVTRAQVASMLPTIFLPFNLIKGGLNAGFTYLLYRPVVLALRKAKLIPESAGGQKKNYVLVTIVAVFVLITCIAMIFVV